VVTCLGHSSLTINPKFRSNFGEPKAAKGQAYFAYSIQPELSKDRERDINIIDIQYRGFKST
jgi:hypothetical protein